MLSTHLAVLFGVKREAMVLPLSPVGIFDAMEEAGRDMEGQPGEGTSIDSNVPVPGNSPFRFPPLQNFRFRCVNSIEA